MSSPAIASGRRLGASSLDAAGARTRSVRRRLNIAWGLLYFNTMTYSPGGLLDFPSKVGKGLAQAALPLAIVLLLTVNPKFKVRPNAFLCLVCLLVADALLTATQVDKVGTAFRTMRLAEFVVALWLLTPWFGRRDMLLLRIHLRWLYVALGTVFLGMLISPGKAFAFDGRLSGIIWPMFPTQVAQYAAIVAGLTIVLWLGRQVSGRLALAGISFAIAILLLTHTRTALVGLVAGILVAGMSLFTVNARVRRVFVACAAIVSAAVLTVAGFITTWLARGENAQGLTSLTGRTNFWGLVLTTPRNKFQEIFGFGISNVSIDGLPIDSNWLASYMQEGLFGVAICALMLIFLFAASAYQPQGVQRALLVFLLTYVSVASFTEVAFTDVSTYLLHLVVAASLLM